MRDEAGQQQESPEPLHAEADRLIRAMYTGKMAWSAREKAYRLKLRAAFATVRDDDGASMALHRLVYGLGERYGLLSTEPLIPHLGAQAGNTGMDALLHLARHHEHWLREPEEWEPDADVTGDARAQLGSLVRHLFALFSLPEFLDAAYLSGFGEQAEEYRTWFAHLGRGGKLEAIRFPIPMTHKAAHFFLHAPADFTIPAALRFGQIRALGGSDALARAIAETYLSELQADEAFWLSVVTFFVNHPRLSLSQVGPVLDFVRFRKFGSSGSNDAPEPNFTMKGRTPDALLARMEEWHETLARMGKKARQSWSPSGTVAPLERTEKDRLSAAECHWRIVELTDTLLLAEEGRAMRHCVRSYQDACVRGASSIFSLRLALSDNPTVRSLLTIEVNNHRRAIVQVRGKCNQSLSSMRGNKRMMYARDVLREWARSQHLGIACSI